MFLLGFRRKLTALALCKSIESAIQWFQIHHEITFATIQNPAVYLSGARVSIFSTLVPRLRIFKRPAKALISLRVYAGWSEPLLVAHTTLLEISCHGSNIIFFKTFIWPFLRSLNETCGMCITAHYFSDWSPY